MIRWKVCFSFGHCRRAALVCGLLLGNSLIACWKTRPHQPEAGADGGKESGSRTGGPGGQTGFAFSGLLGAPCRDKFGAPPIPAAGVRNSTSSSRRSTAGILCWDSRVRCAFWPLEWTDRRSRRQEEAITIEKDIFKAKKKKQHARTHRHTHTHAPTRANAHASKKKPSAARQGNMYVMSAGSAAGL